MIAARDELGAGARAAPARQARLQPDGASLHRRGDRRGGARGLRRLADPPVAARVRGDRAPAARGPRHGAARHRGAAGARLQGGDRRRRHRPWRPVLHAQARRELHQDRQAVRRRDRNRAIFDHDHRDADQPGAQHAHGDLRRGRGDLRAGQISARARYFPRAGLRLRAAAAGTVVPPAARSRPSARVRRGARRQPQPEARSGSSWRRAIGSRRPDS